MMKMFTPPDFPSKETIIRSQEEITISILANEKEKQSENLTEYDPSYDWISYPRSWTYPLQICYFSEIKVLCPAKPEKLVELLYGTSALTKSDTKCVNGSWVDND